jgi:hypothetical protein
MHFEQENIAITGKKTIDGNCDCEHWWPWKGRTNCWWKPGDASQEKDCNQLSIWQSVAFREPSRLWRGALSCARSSFSPTAARTYSLKM